MSHMNDFWSGFVGMLVSFVVGKLLYKKPKTPDAKFSDDATLVTTTDVVPMCYGKNLVHGAVIYNRLASDNKKVHKLIALSLGETEEIKTFLINSMDVIKDKDKFKDLSYSYHLGNNGEIDARVNQDDPYSMVGGLKNITYVALSVTANANLSTDFNIDVVLKGRKIWTPEGVKYSTNPAWIIRDFMTDENGCGLDESLLDLESFKTASDWYDSKGYTLNIKVNESGSAIDWLNKMTNACRSNLVFSGGKYSLIQDDIKPVTMYFDEDTINGLTVSWANFSDIPDCVSVSYLDSEQEYTAQEAIASVEYPKRDVPVTNSVSLAGISTFKMAYEIAWYYLNKSVTCTQYIKFSTDARALQLNAMDVIAVSDYICGFVSKQYQIMSITEKSEQSFVIEAREYNSDIFDEVTTETYPVVDIVKGDSYLNAVPKMLTEVEIEQDYYILADGKIVSNAYLSWEASNEPYSAGCLVRYRKTSQEQWTEAGTFIDGCTLGNLEVGEEYEITFTNTNLNGLQSEPFHQYTTIIGNDVPPEAVKNLGARRSSLGVTIYWDANKEKDLKGYKVYLNGILINTTINNSVTLDDLSSGLGTVEVVAYDYGGHVSVGSILDVTNLQLGSVKDFNVSQSNQALVFTWKAVEGANFYILKQGSDWSSGVLIAKLGSTTATLAMTASNKEVSYSIKAFTDYGEESALATYGRAVVSETSSVNVLDKIEPPFDSDYFDIGSNSATMKTDLYFAENEYTLDLEARNLAYSKNSFHKCRHWLDYSITPLAGEGTTKWEDLTTTTWNSSFANSISWIPLGSEYNFSIQNYVACVENKSFLEYQETILDEKIVNLDKGSFCFQVKRTENEYNEKVLVSDDDSFKLYFDGYSRIKIELNGVVTYKDILSCAKDKVFISLSKNPVSLISTLLIYSSYSQEIITFDSADLYNVQDFKIGLNFSSWNLFGIWDTLDEVWDDLGYFAKSYRFYKLASYITDANFQDYLTPSDFGKSVPFLANDLNTDKVFVTTVCKRTSLKDSVPKFNDFTHVIDVPDTVESQSKTITVNGNYFNFKKEFHMIPSVSAVAKSASVPLNEVMFSITEITKNNYFIQAFHNGVAVEVDASIMITGY